MRKKVTIQNKEYDMCSNAFVLMLHKKEFGVGIMEDIGKLNEYAELITNTETKMRKEGKTEEEITSALNDISIKKSGDILEIGFRLAYTFIKCANKDFMPFEDWLKSLEPDITGDWITEVADIATQSFCGQGPSGPAKLIEEKK